MMIGKFVIKGSTMLNKNINENIGDVICDDLWSADSETRIARATEFDTFGRAVANLTQNTFEDVEITITQSVEAILGE